MRLADLSPWTDPETGLILAKDGGNDNLATCTATALQFLGPEDKAELREKVVHFLRACEIEPGLYSRRPNDHGAGSIDNTLAIVALSYGLDTDHRFDVLRYAENHNWTFDVENPNLGDANNPLTRHNYGKFGGIPPFFDIAVGRALPLYDQVILGGATYVTALSPYGDTSDKCLQVLINQVVEKRYAVCTLGLLAWKLQMKHKYPRGQRELYEIYWGVSHPYTLASPALF